MAAAWSIAAYAQESATMGKNKFPLRGFSLCGFNRP
jgi:hypothetical protein